MKRFGLIFLLLLIGCAARPTTASATETSIPAATQTETLMVTVTAPKPTFSPTATPTVMPTSTVTPTPNTDGSLNCQGSVALMYHSIVPGPEITKGFGLTTDIGSFEKVLVYLLDNGFYFPTPEEFAADLRTGVCRHKYAIITIDDSWNDPEIMGVVQVLLNHGGGSGANGSPNVWFGVITWKISSVKNEAGEWIDPWKHLKSLSDKDLIYVVSHSQTHPAELIDKTNYHGSANDQVYTLIANEAGPSRNNIVRQLSYEPLFFIYPGGNVNRFVVEALAANGYAGAFTVSPGGLDGAYAYYLPRINGGARCDDSLGDNSSCVINQIELLQNN